MGIVTLVLLVAVGIIVAMVAYAIGADVADEATAAWYEAGYEDGVTDARGHVEAPAAPETAPLPEPEAPEGRIPTARYPAPPGFAGEA